MSMASRLIMIASAVGFAACATNDPVRVDQAEAGVGQCKTFEWLAQANSSASLSEQRIRDVALAELKRKGYEVSSDKSDCRITYALNSHEVPKEKPRVGAGVGGGSGGLGGGIGISLPIGKRDSHAGTLTIDIVDVAKNSQIWSGSLDASFAGAELNEEEAAELVKAILDRYPNRTP